MRLFGILCRRRIVPPESDADHFYLGVACDECMTTGRTDGFGAGFSGHLTAG